MGTNINRQKILSRKVFSIHDGVGGYNPGTCSDYNCTSGVFGGTDDAVIAPTALWNAMSVEPSSTTTIVSANCFTVSITFPNREASL